MRAGPHRTPVVRQAVSAVSKIHMAIHTGGGPETADACAQGWAVAMFQLLVTRRNPVAGCGIASIGDKVFHYFSRS